MPLKEELEILRGEPIEVLSGNPLDIPYIETSDPDKLCKNPVVSVHMVTYNHEPYIRQAIEGVIMQRTDFEFELVIGEDCSTDKTREICFEYQKRHPDKIRVLWWHENLNQRKHPAGGNGKRNIAHCRGEFIAYCEGDDYWIDPLKLQKQIDVMRKHPNVGLCHCRNRMIGLDGTEWGSDRNDGRRSGVIPSDEFVARHVFGWDFKGAFGRGASVTTPTALFRRSFIDEANKKFDIFTWRLLLGDEQNYLGVGCISDVYFMTDEMAVYRRNPGSAVSTLGGLLRRDHILVRMYFARMMYGLAPSDISPAMLDNFRLSIIRSMCQKRKNPDGSLLCHPSRYIVKVLTIRRNRRVFLSFRAFPTMLFLLFGFANSFVIRVQSWFHRKFLKDSFSRAGKPFFQRFLEHQ